MSVFMVFRVALKALGRNKMRTALTMLGMIIGVAAVITMVALGTGAQTSIEAQIQGTDVDFPLIRSWPATRRRARATSSWGRKTSPTCRRRRAARR